MNGIWHRWSDLIIAGDYADNGYWSFPAGTGGYPSAPNNYAGTKFARMVHVPDTQAVIHAGVDQFPSAYNTIYVGRIDFDGILGGFAQAIFSDGFTGNCNLVSASQTDFLCYDGTAVRHYATSEFGPDLLFVKSVTLTEQPTVVCGANCYGGTFAWDGVNYYFSDVGNSSSGRLYAVYDSTGTLVGKFTANGSGNINSVYFDWSVGQYATHDGFGLRSGTNNYTWASGSQSDDSQCYTPSTAHALP